MNATKYILFTYMEWTQTQAERVVTKWHFCSTFLSITFDSVQQFGVVNLYQWDDSFV